ncbi:hypothetical protein [uncultured Paraglaciecola sp.]|jgi:hypothetical protein|uniref:hypothetical protein n=1 Tax=uncultured Paraglaciecola sp. TaxID=1765024 RepID=UPI0025F014B0|nr:hypothetical protein [uncultured Paraglaciecola sp.]
MNKPMVLVIHGIGTHKPGETKKAIADGLNQAAKNFGLSDFDVNDKVEFFQFNYSDFLDEIRLKDAKKAGELVDHLSLLKGRGLGEKAASELVEFFSEADEDKFFNTHWLDVIYYGLMFWGENIRVDLAKKINDLMIEREQGNRKLHIVAHSLGTAVLHDTLAKLFRKDTDITSKVPHLDVDRFKIDSIWTVANVSRLVNLLNDIADPNESIVSCDSDGCTSEFYNIKNEFDPFTWFKEYKRPINQSGRHITVKTVREIDTHDLKEYMEAPIVAEAFLSNVLNISVTDEQYAQGTTKHASTSINYSYKQLKATFDNLHQQNEPMDKFKAILAIVEAADSFQEKITDMMDQA